MEDNFDSVQWRDDDEDSVDDFAHHASSSVKSPVGGANGGSSSSSTEHQHHQQLSPGLQAGPNADALDLAGVGRGVLETFVSDPQTEGEGTKDAYVSYRVTTKTDFPTFQKPHVDVRRRFTDFVYLWKTLSREFPACAVPPLPEKHKMEYVRGDRFGPDFTQRRAHSLHRFLKRLTLHPSLRRTPILTVFLESPDWNAHMRLRPTRGNTGQAPDSGGGVFDGLTDTFLNAFSKVHKPDDRFIVVRDRADKLDEDLTHVEKLIARVVRREADMESDYSDLSKEFLKIVELEPELDQTIRAFSTGVKETSEGLRALKEHTDQDYLSSLRDMEAYIGAVKQLLKSREQKQLDYEGLMDYRERASMERDHIASAPVGSTGLGGPTGFLRSKIEDVRGVDHEASRRERVRKLEHKIDMLNKEAEEARKITESFDEEVLREVADFERIKCIEMKDTLGGLADANVKFYKGMVETWEKMLKQLDEQPA
ncbi:hypothetical protein BZA05DRAFT_358640 [Tricharina praecox]|uniref:uncharacterized protein n=1 Tax=Tricharina praecox TaxID=43433 RepID=UPI002220F673|nr:uncharacterized protein BZA05DRAFT_358640 [Tricharina praecox]KAI5844257.1 hypothetical protein BZA05DRAFT_358640 [Tricharina praecox]